MYNSILFARNINVLLSFCYGLVSIYVKIPIVDKWYNLQNKVYKIN